MQKQLLTENDIKSAESVLAKGDRVEIIPVKDGARVIRIKREEVREIKQSHRCAIVKKWREGVRIVDYAESEEEAISICEKLNKDLSVEEKIVNDTIYLYRREIK